MDRHGPASSSAERVAKNCKKLKEKLINTGDVLRRYQEKCERERDSGRCAAIHAAISTVVQLYEYELRAGNAWQGSYMAGAVRV